jgi:hypothetical protein
MALVNSGGVLLLQNGSLASGVGCCCKECRCPQCSFQVTVLEKTGICQFEFVPAFGNASENACYRSETDRSYSVGGYTQQQNPAIREEAAASATCVPFCRINSVSNTIELVANLGFSAVYSKGRSGNANCFFGTILEDFGQANQNRIVIMTAVSCATILPPGHFDVTVSGSDTFDSGSRFGNLNCAGNFSVTFRVSYSCNPLP